MTDERLIELHNQIVDYVQMYADGFLLITEFARAMAEINAELAADSPVGMLDPNSGLRFPPLEAYQA